MDPSLHLHLAAVLLAISAVQATLGALVVRNRYEPGAPPMAAALFSTAIWLTGSAAEILFASSPTLFLLARDYKYIGILGAVLGFFFFALHLVRGKPAGGALVWALSVVPLLSLGLIWTNPWHEWMWAHPPTPPTTGVRTPWGPWWVWIQTPYMYGLLAAGQLALLLELFRARHLTRPQAAALLAGSAVPFAVNIVYNIRPELPDLQQTPLAFAVTALVYAWAFFGFQLYRARPLAMRGAFEAVADAVVLIDGQSRVVDANGPARRLLGEGSGPLLGQLARAVLDRNGLGLVPVAPGTRSAVRGPDDRYLESETSEIAGPDGSSLGRVLVLRDVSERYRAEWGLHESEAMMRAVLESSPNGVVRLRPIRAPEGRIRDFSCVFANPSANRQLAPPGDTLLGRTLGEVRPPHTAVLLDVFRRVADQRSSVDTVVQAGGESPLWFRVTSSPLGGDVLVTFVDITQEKQREMTMVSHARQDPLTGLLNRRGLEDDAEALLASASEEGRGLGLLFLDLDGFKTINDTWGHEAGDQALKTVAARLVRCLRVEDLIARIGGDEFVALVAEATPREALGLAERIRNVVGAPIAHSSTRLEVVPSIGIALFPMHGSAMEELLRAADAAMYTSKRTGSGASLAPPRPAAAS
ncbi:MAG: diguanylate cyclase [Gemmatimonadota bacterium]